MMIVGVCGGSAIQRAEVIRLMRCIRGVEVSTDVTVSSSIRAPWRRGEALANALDVEVAALAPTPLVVASINSFEESEEIEALGGHVIHIEGLPSDDVPIERSTIMVTTGEPRGRYITPAMALEKMAA
ncbi:MAG: hypothetical protein ACRDC7_21905 [Aeromonas veronii]